MSSSPWLPVDEVAELKALKPNSWQAQCRKLAIIGITFFVERRGQGRQLGTRQC